jgi:hypothetical protein
MQLGLRCEPLTNDFLGWTCDERRILRDDLERLQARIDFLQKRFGK